uniref:Uncharacterized protein n=1 Tax=Anguilla anguilla TaxID=7936 RepID=A0A0E9SV97_ANGAN
MSLMALSDIFSVLLTRYFIGHDVM